MTASAMLGMVMITGFGYLLYRWNRWSKQCLAKHGISNPVSGNPAKGGRKRKVYEQDRPYAECFDDNEFEMEDDL